ncbi:hypothetical protein RI367_007695 [Sorochytrium milnesiophthora]
MTGDTSTALSPTPSKLDRPGALSMAHNNNDDGSDNGVADIVRYTREDLVQFRSSPLAAAPPYPLSQDVFKRQVDEATGTAVDKRLRKVSVRARGDAPVEKKADSGGEDSDKWIPAEDKRQARRERKISTKNAENKSVKADDKDRRPLLRGEKAREAVDAKAPLGRGRGRTMELDKDFDRRVQDLGDRRRGDRKEVEGRRPGRQQPEESAWDKKKLGGGARRFEREEEEEPMPEWMADDILTMDDHKNEETFELGGAINKNEEFDLTSKSAVMEEFLAGMRKQHGRGKKKDVHEQQAHSAPNEEIDPIEAFRRQMRAADNQARPAAGRANEGTAFTMAGLHEDPAYDDAGTSAAAAGPSRFADRYFAGNRQRQHDAPPETPVVEGQQQPRFEARAIENEIRNMLFFNGNLPGPGQLRRDLNMPLPGGGGGNMAPHMQQQQQQQRQQQQPAGPPPDSDEHVKVLLSKLHLHGNSHAPPQQQHQQQHPQHYAPQGYPPQIYQQPQQQQATSSRGNTPPMSPRDGRPPEMLDEADRERILRKKASLMFGGNIPTSVVRQYAGKVDVVKPEQQRPNVDLRATMEHEQALMREEMMRRERERAMLAQYDPRTHVQIPRTAQQMTAYHLAQQQQQQQYMQLLQQRQQHMQQQNMHRMGGGSGGPGMVVPQQMPQQFDPMAAQQRPRAPLPPGMDMPPQQRHPAFHPAQNPMTPAILQMLQSQQLQQQMQQQAPPNYAAAQFPGPHQGMGGPKTRAPPPPGMDALPQRQMTPPSQGGHQAPALQPTAAVQQPPPLNVGRP